MSVKELVTTIGLEIHVELKTNSKMFCGCPVDFAGEPNSRVCPVCLGHPGTLPAANERAVEFATKIAMALGCEIAPKSIFHRKNYFYPDMPKNYQISQYDIPIGLGGLLDIEVDSTQHRVGITRVHLEEDTGKSLHVGGGGRIQDATYSLEDFNRAGTPLVEIVTEPDITSPASARVFAAELKLILEFLEVSDVRMEEGSMRVDGNISVAPPGERGVKSEVKNMNSLRSLERALAYEQTRQAEVIAQGGTLEQSTRHWDEKSGKTQTLRSKEEAFDYRYFPEPDLVPIEPPVEWLRQLRDEIPELPAARRKRLIEESGLSEYDAGILTADRAVSAFYQEAAGAASVSTPKQIANWIANELAGLLAEKSLVLTSAPITPRSLAELSDLVAGKEISRQQGKEVLAEMLDSHEPPAKIVAERGLSQASDSGELEAAINEAIAQNADVAERIRGGDAKPFGFLVGQIMKATKGTADPGAISALLKEKLK